MVTFRSKALGMRKLLITLFLIIPMTTFAQSSNGPDFITRMLMYFGFKGGVYKTEVPIPIQEIRYQNKQDMRLQDYNYNFKYIIDYTKAFGNYPIDAIKVDTAIDKKLAEPYLDANLRYSIYTDPFTGETLIVLRPKVKFERNNHIFNPNLKANLPVPIDVADIQPKDASTKVPRLIDKNA